MPKAPPIARAKPEVIPGPPASKADRAASKRPDKFISKPMRIKR